MAPRDKQILTWQDKIKAALRIRNPYVREGLAEFIGTMIFVVLGNASVAQLTFTRNKAGELLYLSWAWGLAVAMGIWFAGGVSGGHINPAVTLALCCIGHVPWKKLPFYLVGQYLGAFVASIWIYGAFYDQLNRFDGGVRQVYGPNATAIVWCSYPNEHVSTANGLLDQILGTAILMAAALAMTDERNWKPPKGTLPFFLGLIVFCIVCGFVTNVCTPLNPARDFSPRLFTLMAGWGVETFSYRNYNWFWVPIVGTHVGAIVGAFMYMLCVGNHWPDEEEEEVKQKRATLPQNEIVELRICDKKMNGDRKTIEAPLLSDSKA